MTTIVWPKEWTTFERMYMVRAILTALETHLSDNTEVSHTSVLANVLAALILLDNPPPLLHHYDDELKRAVSLIATVVDKK